MANRVKGFRLEDSLVSELQNESEQKRISLNNHVSNILTKHAISYRHLEKLHYLWSSPELIKALLESLDQDKIKKILKIYEKDLIRQIRYSQGDLNSITVMNLIENNCLLQDIPYTKQNKGNGEVKYIILHQLGEKWSDLNKMALENIMKSISATIKDFDYNGEHLSLTVIHK